MQETTSREGPICRTKLWEDEKHEEKNIYNGGYEKQQGYAILI